MKRRDTLIIEERAYSWRAILEMRQAQLAALKGTQPQQPTLFELKDDARPRAERTAAGRYRQPTLFEE